MRNELIESYLIYLNEQKWTKMVDLSKKSAMRLRRSGLLKDKMKKIMSSKGAAEKINKLSSQGKKIGDKLSAHNALQVSGVSGNKALGTPIKKAAGSLKQGKIKEAQARISSAIKKQRAKYLDTVEKIYDASTPAEKMRLIAKSKNHEYNIDLLRRHYAEISKGLAK